MEASDRAEVLAFLEAQSCPGVPQAALIGKLVGNLVAVLSFEITDEAVLIHDLVVAKDLRKKRIGRFMIDESYALAAKFERRWLVFQRSEPAAFLKRVGFAERDRQMVRRVVV